MFQEAKKIKEDASNTKKYAEDMKEEADQNKKDVELLQNAVDDFENFVQKDNDDAENVSFGEIVNSYP